MRTKFFPLFLAAVLLGVGGCNEQSTQPPVDLPAPVLLQNPDEMAVVERGIDAIAERNAIQIQWLPDSRFERLRIYRRAASEPVFAVLAEPEAADTLYSDDSVQLNQRYFYTAVGVDDQGNGSPPADTLDYLLIPKAINLSISISDSLFFYWQLSDVLPDRYVLKLFSDDNDQPIWFSLIQSSYSGLEEQVRYNWDGNSVLPRLVSRHRYRWRVDIIGPSLRSGSESNWHRFLIP